MTNNDLRNMSIDELWALHEKVSDILAAKLVAEKKSLEARLQRLQTRTVQPTVPQLERRPYPAVQPKFRNPETPSETWSGRGKKPRWLSKQLISGKNLEDFLITALAT